NQPSHKVHRKANTAKRRNNSKSVARAPMVKNSGTVDVDEFLDAIGLPQYRQCLLLNLGFSDGTGNLSKQKLAQLQMQQLPQMNISQFDHEKRIMARMRQLLFPEGTSPPPQDPIDDAHNLNANGTAESSLSSESGLVHAERGSHDAITRKNDGSSCGAAGAPPERHSSGGGGNGGHAKHSIGTGG
ncbi:unnamed protein product, partial [Phaeothamnion confervicola]